MSELTDQDRQVAIGYVNAVVARAEGRGDAPVQTTTVETMHKPLVTRLVPGAVKRRVVRMLRYVLRHPFDHLAHPLEIRFESQIAETRAMARSALRRAEQNATELETLRKELDRRSRQPRA